VGRSGLNTNLSYSYRGKTYAFSCRVKEIAFGSRMIASESQARTRRAYYPHQVSSVPFSIVPIIKGYKERVQFSNFLGDYVKRVQDPSLSVSKFPTMKVSSNTRKFLRWGVPVSGIEWGDHVGSMVWTPRVVFETHVDQSLGESTRDYQWISYFVFSAGSLQRAPQIAYFYPSGIQLSGSQVPDADAYDKVTSIQDIQNIINGGTSGGSDAGDVNPNWGGVPFLPGQGPGQNLPLGPVGR
jgi:hypothetical protein